MVAPGWGKTTSQLILSTALRSTMLRYLDYPEKSYDVQGNNLYDLVHDLSVTGAKNHEYTSRDGHLRGVLCDITVRLTGPALANEDNVVSILGMSNTWKLRNAIRKFHFLRMKMFKDSGITKGEIGKYGQTIRPYLDPRHAGTQLVPGGQSTVTVEPIHFTWLPGDPDPGSINGSYKANSYLGGGAGYWARTEFATVPSYEATVSGGGPEGTLPPADSWTLTLADEFVVEAASTGTLSSTVTYKSVGAVQAYLLDRQQVQVMESDTSIDGPNNPLAALAAGGNQSVGEILDIAEQQEEMVPPYDLSDRGDAVKLSVLGSYQFPTTNGTHTFRNLFIPAGLFRVLGGLNASDMEFDIEVLGEFECREMA